MFRNWGIAAVFVTLSVAPPAPAQQPASEPTARELFYQAAPPKNAQPAKPAQPAARPKPPQPAPSQASSSTPTPTATSASATQPQPAASVSSEPATVGPPPHARPAQEASANLPVHIIRASDEKGPPLGLRYSIVRLISGRMVEVSPDFVFHNGDHIQLRVQANTPGYLYVVNKGSSGTWAPMFPSPEIANGDNQVDGFHTYILPTPDYQMSFNGPTGTENLTIVFSRQPVSDFETLIYSLQGQADGAPPAGQPNTPRTRTKIMSASVRIDDDTVGRLRTASTRDLIVEHVDSNTPPDSSSADKKETAVYVVNPTGKPDSRLVADLHLVHQ